MNADPFSPGGTTFRPVSANLVTVRLISVGLSLGIPLLVLAALAIWVTPWLWIGAGVLLAFLLWLLWLIPRQVRAIGYAESDDDLVIRRGILFKSMSIVPYGRMQFVDVHQGPLDRRFDISSVQLHTASASTDATLPGLPADEASRLRDRLTARGEARLAGL
ncbi:MAG: PH domain-containing protein [Actinomycetota bacterium]